MIKPAALNPGDKIGVFSPSSYADKKKVLAAKKFLEDKGYEVYLHPQYEARFNQSAGTHQEKIDALHDLLKDDSIKAIFAAAGGNRGMHILDDIDYDLVRKHPKIIMGFSDITSLLNAFHTKADLTTFHGPVFYSIPEYEEMFDFNMSILSGDTPDYPFEQADILREGTATGPLVGGILSLFHLMTSTEYADVPQGSILFLEDINEEMNALDRMFLQLKRTGVLDKISGLICGEFTQIGDSGRPYGFTLKDIVREHTEGLDIPVIMNAPFGHGDNLYAMPLGVPVTLKAKNGKVKLSLDEPAVKKPSPSPSV